jgi:N-acetylglucosaminyldiphosphoundecaprenol N-acetyl-beta-D-mannosaminyltransferase
MTDSIANVSVGRTRGAVLGALIDATTWPSAISTIGTWADQRLSRYVCICNVHSVVTASRDRVFQEVINNADMATPDGAPIAWMLRRLGHAGQERINGPDLMWRYLERAEQHGDAVYFYGSTDRTLALLRAAIEHRFPRLKVAGLYSPPFREAAPEEDEAEVQAINASGAGVVFVGLGCPKQELWMAAHRGRIAAVMVGVGAAFDYHAGTVKRAPLWMQRNGLEWLHRLASEPGRLWKRYLSTNSVFILRAAWQLLVARRKTR